MRSRIGFVLNRLATNMAWRGTTVTLQWVVRTGGTADAGTGAMIGGTEVRQTMTVQAFVYIDDAKSTLRQFTEIQIGDIILDMDPSVEIDGLEDLQFLVNGQYYRQKEIGGELSKAWDFLIQGNEGFRTVLLKLAT